MRYGVIYTVDIPRTIAIGSYKPPHPSRWRLTEGDDQYEFDYLEDVWAKGKHRKWVGELSQEQFDNFVEDQCFYAEDCETMGSLGVPWTESGFGIAPAVSFRSDNEYNAFLGAYVTPLLEKQDAEKLREVYGEDEEAWWEHVREEVINHYTNKDIKPYPTRQSILLEKD